ncbi:MAG: DUF262 domain-containing protein [Aetokthonos hydrillicola CCALA 1050]|jgi:hypothetical protein|nr:DUF262 domain-containing protein [Aetokthonos hydrillicola CCALA 1050]
MTESFSPLVQDTTKAQSESIETVLSRLKSGRVYIPDYQRDAEQWKCEKKALFIESILNNLTIPAFFFCEDDNRNYEVVDGQQRLSTIWDFSENKLTMNDSLKIDYMSPASALYAGKTYSNLIPTLKNIFNDYPLTIIYLPKSLPLQTKLEIFRRINEGGTPLSGQDIRLAYYIRSKSVTFIRVVGIYSSSTDSIEDTVETEAEPEFIKKPFQRMIELAEGKGIPNPWDNFPESKKNWDKWWEGKETAKGQTPSLMFLWYLVSLEREKLDALLKKPKHLPISFGGLTETALDIYCAQLQYQELDNVVGNQNVLLPFEVISDNYFKQFAIWMEFILSSKLGISVDKYKQLALFIAGAVELNISPESLAQNQWKKAGEFIRNPRKVGNKVLNDDDGYPEPRGRWGGLKGQMQQCEKTVEIVKVLLK